MLRSIGKQSGESIESVLKKKITREISNTYWTMQRATILQYLHKHN